MGRRTRVGEVMFENRYRGYNIGDIIVYHDLDIKYIQLGGEIYEAVLYYHVMLNKKPTEVIEEGKKESGMIRDFWTD
jgi:hypothetical protein